MVAAALASALSSSAATSTRPMANPALSTLSSSTATSVSQMTNLPVSFTVTEPVPSTSSATQQVLGSCSSSAAESLASVTVKSSRNWAKRRQPYLQQEKKTVQNASLEASQKITELSSAKLELVKLRIEVEKASEQRAIREHELRLQFLREEHDLKMKLLNAQLQSSHSSVNEL